MPRAWWRLRRDRTRQAEREGVRVGRDRVKAQAFLGEHRVRGPPGDAVHPALTIAQTAPGYASPEGSSCSSASDESARASAWSRWVVAC